MSLQSNNALRISSALGRRSSPALMLYTVYFVYFFCGMTQCFEGVFLPEFKTHFHLSYQQQMYTMFAKNFPFLFAAFIGASLRFIGYKASLVLALVLFGAGTALLVPGLETRQYLIVLAGFLLIGVGFNFEIVAGNPMLSALGPPVTASSRLNLGNALGAVAQIIAPASLSFIIPAAAVTVQARIPWIQGLFAVLAVLLFLFAFAVAAVRSPALSPEFIPPAAVQEAARSTRKLPRHVFIGLAAITLSLGAEAALFGFYRNYLEDPSIAGLAPAQSARLFTVYFALFAAGRLAASWAQKKVRPVVHLAINLIGAIVFISVALFARGTTAVILITAMGFWVATFYPTLYSLATERLSDLTAKASGVLTMGFLGAALFPVLQGRLADSIGLHHSYLLIAVAYLSVGLCTITFFRPRPLRFSDDPAPKFVS